MKGLLIKDLSLIKMQGRFLVIVAFLGVFMALNADNPTFVIGYMSYMGAIFTMNTISYDEFENGNAFLFALPITRKMYAMEKYVFGIILGGVLLAFSTVRCVIFELYRGFKDAGSIAETALWTIPLLLVMLAVVIPIQLKFGGEKGRIVTIAAIGVAVVLGIAIVRFVNSAHFDLNGLYRSLSFLESDLILPAAFLISCALLLVSYRISAHIVERKEF